MSGYGKLEARPGFKEILPITQVPCGNRRAVLCSTPIGVEEALGTHSRVSMASYAGTPMDQGCQLEDEAVLNGRATALVVHDGCEVVGWLVSTVPIGL